MVCLKSLFLVSNENAVLQKLEGQGPMNLEVRTQFEDVADIY